MKILMLIILMLANTEIRAVTITVNSGEFDATVNGNCNFAEAVLSAGFDLAFDQCSQGSGDDTIVFDVGLFPLPSNTLMLDVDDTLIVFGDSIDIQIPDEKWLSLDSDGNQAIFNIDLNPGSTFSLNRSLLKNASSTFNGGAMQFDEDVDEINLSEVTFENNSTSDFGGAIGFDRVSGATNVTSLNISDCHFVGNSASSGGAIFAAQFVKVNITECHFIDNLAGDSGGAMVVDDDLTLNTVVFNGNQAQYGGGVFATSGDSLIENSLFENNTAITAGGGLYKSNFESVTTTELEFRRNTVINNLAGTGAGLYVGYNQLFFINNLIANNTASGGVGGLEFDLVDAVDGVHQLHIIGNSFYHNIGQGSGAVADISSYLSNGVSTYIGNLIVSESDDNAFFKCQFLRINDFDSKHNLSSEDSNCLLGSDNQLLMAPLVALEPQTGFHPFRIEPQVSSPLIDAWARTDCYDHNALLLDFDLTGRRNDSGLFDIHNGDGFDAGQCDIGAAEVPDAVLVAVGQIGSGSGRIYGNPETTIDCPGPAVCEVALVIGEEVTFSTDAYPGSGFVQWGLDGSSCGTSANCQLTVPDFNITVAAEFESSPVYLLTVTKDGSGSGLVYSTPTLIIECGSSCLANVDENELVTLEASPAAGDVFVGWSGDCSGSGTCQFNMDSDKSVIATFNNGSELSVISNADGVINSADGLINCPGDCFELYDSGAVVTLTANPNAGYVFSGWTGACSGSENCILDMSVDNQVGADFIDIDIIFQTGFEAN